MSSITTLYKQVKLWDEPSNCENLAVITHSLYLRLCIFMSTEASTSSLLPAPRGVTPTARLLAMGLLTPELRGEPESGLMLMGEVWLMGDMSALAGVAVPKSMLDDALELTPEHNSGVDL